MVDFGWDVSQGFFLRLLSGSQDTLLAFFVTDLREAVSFSLFHGCWHLLCHLGAFLPPSLAAAVQCSLLPQATPTPTLLCCCTHTSPFWSKGFTANPCGNRENKNNKHGKVSEFLTGWCPGFGLLASEDIKGILVGALSLLLSTMAIFGCCSPGGTIGASKSQVTPCFLTRLLRDCSLFEKGVSLM